MKKLGVGVIALFLQLSMFKSDAIAVGSGAYENQVPSARALGRANSVVASIDDAASGSFNAARLTSVENTQVSIGVVRQKTDVKYTPATGNSDESISPTSYSPNFHLASSFPTAKISIGFGIDVPHGNTTEWSNTSPLRYITTKSEFAVVNYNPSIAYKVTDKLSFGIGLDYYKVQKLKLQNRLNVSGLNSVLGAPSIAPDGNQVLEGDGSALSFDLGASWIIRDSHLFGISYKNGEKMEVEGSLKLQGLSGASASVFGSNYETSAKSTVVIPREITLGYAYKPSNKSTIEFDGQWVEWSKFKEQKVDFSETDPVRQSILNSGNPTPKNWMNAWSFGVGGERLIGKVFAVRAGYAFLQKAVPNETFEASTPDSDLHKFTAGAGYFWKGFQVDLAAVYYRPNTRHINNNVGSSSGTTGNGTYSASGQYYAFDIGYKFGKVE